MTVKLNFELATVETSVLSSRFYEQTIKSSTAPAKELSQCAPLYDRLFMILRELPDYLSTARALRFTEVHENENVFRKCYRFFNEHIQLIKEIFSYRPNHYEPDPFASNIRKLDADFEKNNQLIGRETKPICAYFVSSHDENGAILGDHLYYYHHYKMKNFAKHYSVAAKVIRTSDEMFQFLRQLKEQNPNREIKVVDLVCHGDPSTLAVKKVNGQFYKKSDLKEDEFKHCARDAAIILDACSVGKGNMSIANEIAKKNPGKRVIAPGASLFFSKPIISKQNGQSFVEHVVHGFAIFNAYTSRQFKY